MKLLLMLALLVGLPASAAVKKGSLIKVTLRTGSKVFGEVVNETANGLLVANGSKTQMVNYSDISELDELTPVPAKPAPEPSRRPLKPGEN